MQNLPNVNSKVFRINQKREPSQRMGKLDHRMTPFCWNWIKIEVKWYPPKHIKSRSEYTNTHPFREQGSVIQKGEAVTFVVKHK